jgi:hypothetical protein
MSFGDFKNISGDGRSQVPFHASFKARTGTWVVNQRFRQRFKYLEHA